MTAVSVTHVFVGRGALGASLAVLALLTAGPLQAAGLGAGVGASAGRGGVSAGVSAGGVSASASAGHSGATAAASTSAASVGTSATASAGASGTNGASAGVGASASASGSTAGVGATAGAGGSTGGTASAGAGLGVGTSASTGTGGLSTAGGVSRGAAGVGLGVNGSAAVGSAATSTSAANPGAIGSSQTASGIQTVDDASEDQFTAVQHMPERDDAVYLRGLGSQTQNYLVRCSSWFCRTHLLGRDAPGPSRLGPERRDASRRGTFDAVIMAAEAGNPDAEFMVAEVLAGGHGVPANPRRAATWYARAAQHGNTLAVARLNRLRAAVADSQ